MDFTNIWNETAPREMCTYTHRTMNSNRKINRIDDSSNLKGNIKASILRQR